MKTCLAPLHLYVSGFGGHFAADAVVCIKCGLCKYPEVAPGYMIANSLGRVIYENHPDYDDYRDLAIIARDKRKASQ